ncbi:MAG: SMUG2 DNA glycosylase family protein [Oscillospiraceae bacterium]|jgi:hypothetical protein|nr:SMUG2 DNA glycosylase family protein [Oscillospiraceae bacterium]
MAEEHLAGRILQHRSELSQDVPMLPIDYHALIPPITERLAAFYHQHYSDTHPRRLILGSSPARRGSAQSGIPFVDDAPRPASAFLADVIAGCGGEEAFYKQFLMDFLCPLALVRTTAQRREVNANYYESTALQQALTPLMLAHLQGLIALGIDRSVCFCIGSGENFRFLSQINAAQGFFERLVPLEHPRFIMQYHAAQRGVYLEKYLRALRGDSLGFQELL